MLYIAADTVRERTVFEFLEFHATWIGCAVVIDFLVPNFVNPKGCVRSELTVRKRQKQCHDNPCHPSIDGININRIQVYDKRQSPDLRKHGGQG